MLIDPFTVLAQIINFLILVALLQRFLYGPITRAMAQRKQTIDEQLAQAKQQATLAEQETARLQQMQDEFAAHRDQRFNQLRSAIEDQRLSLVEQAEDEVEAARSRWYRALDQEKTMVLSAFRQQAAYQLTQTVRQVLVDLANAPLEQQVATTFLSRLHHLPPSEQQTLQTALAQANGVSVVILSSFPLTAAIQQDLSEAVQTMTAQPLPKLQFEVDPALGCGIELKVPGYKLAWHLAAYLESMMHNLSQILDQPSDADPAVIAAQPHVPHLLR